MFSEKQGKSYFKYYSAVCHNLWVDSANNRTYLRKKRPSKLKSRKSDVKTSNTTLLLNTWNHCTFRRWVYTAERKAVNVADAGSSPPTTSGWEALSQGDTWVRGCLSRWHLSYCSNVASQCSCGFPEACASATGRRAVELGTGARRRAQGEGKWEANEREDDRSDCSLCSGPTFL